MSAAATLAFVGGILRVARSVRAVRRLRCARSPTALLRDGASSVTVPQAAARLIHHHDDHVAAARMIIILAGSDE